MSESASSRTSAIAAGLFLCVVTLLLTPLGLIIADAVADPQVVTSAVASTDPTSDQIGATAAEFRVDESGSATYSIPIYTVPGTAGVVPQLNLGYSSQGGYGPLGKGWSIGGLSSISRCRATREAGDFIVSGVATDGNPAPINYTASDRYCLDGQRLLPGVGGAVCQAVSGMSVQTLRTEIESFQRVCAYTPTGSGNGPAFFTVERKDGSKSWYGDRVVSTIQNLAYNGYVKSTTPGRTDIALSWLQTRFQDSTGNYIDYVYTVPTAGEHLINEVRYTGKTVLDGQGGSALSPYAKVMFTYSARPAAQISKGYAAGGVLTQSRRLDSITVCASAASGCSTANQARYYQLTYTTSASGSNYQNLASVQECRDSSKSVCLPETTFAWSAGKHEFATIEKSVKLNIATDHIRGFKTADFSGDGRQDIALLYLAGSGCVGGTWVVTSSSMYLSTGTPSFGNERFNCVPVKIVDRGDGAWHLFDYDGDGRDDLFVSNATGQGWKVHPGDGTGFNMSANLISSLSPAIPSMDGKNDQVHLADLNGDGLMDIVYPRAGALRARIMERAGSNFAWAAERTVAVDMASLGPTPCEQSPSEDMTCSRSISGVPTPKTHFAQLADFNGDAASDLLIRVTTHVTQRVWTGNCQIESLPPDVELASFSATTEDGAAVLPYRSADETDTISVMGEFDCWRTETWSTDNLHAMTVKSLTSSSVSVASYGVLSTGNPDTLILADSNGDGLTDAFVRTGSNSDWHLAINKGNGFTFGPTFTFSSYRELAQFVDVNGDGRADALHLGDYGGNKVFYVRYALPDGTYAASTLLGANARICEGSGCDPKKRAPMFMDLDGDGNLDFLSLDYSSGNLGLYISRASSRYTPRDTITRITNGLGAQTEVTYAPLTNAALYRRDTGSRALNWGRGAPVQDLLAPMYAVARAASSSPQAGNANAKATVHYRYAGAKVQAGGRGFLGFREIATIDPNHDAGYVTTTSTYHQNFPYAGMPARTIKRAVVSGSYAIPACLNGTIDNTCFATPGQAFPVMAGNWFSDSTQVWEADTDIALAVRAYAAGEQRPIHVRTAGTEEKLRDPVGGAQTSRVVTTFSYGTYGNVTDTTVDTYTGTSGTAMSTVITANSYADNGTLWRLGRLSGSTVTHRRPSRTDVVRTASFAYSTGGPYTGLLTAERSQSGQGAAQDLRKQYIHDDFGNRTTSMTCADPATSCSTSITFRPATPTQIQRYSRTTYDSRGRYPVRTYEPFFNGTGGVERVTQHVVSRNLFGDPTEIRDVNGTAAIAISGALGRPYYSWSQTVPGAAIGDPAGGVESLTTYRLCGTASGQASCPTGAKFRQETVATGAPATWTYFDVLGRPVMQATLSFNIGVSGKDVSAVCTDYNAAGQPRRVSNPFFLSGTAGSNGPTVTSNVCTSGRDWNMTQFDVLGRPTDAVAADGSIVSTDYVGNTTIVTDGRGNTTTQVRNGAGEVTSVTDANGTAQTHVYYADGSLYYTDRNAGRGVVRNAFYYDAAGRKIRQVDPDAGTTYFEYNALGELTAQQDAASNRIEHEIDARGRVWRKTVKSSTGVVESQSTFTFDTATNGVGQLASETITGTYSAWAGQSGLALSYSRSYSYDALGRPTTTTTMIDGTAYATETQYNALGQAWKAKDASGRWILQQYNARGHLQAVCPTTATSTSTGCPGSTIPTDPAARTAMRALETNAWGHVIREQRGQSANLEVRRSYHAKSGRLSSICGGSSTCSLMEEQYAWDAAGNLHTQLKENRYLEEFTYDKLNRLTTAKLKMQNGVTVNTTSQTFQFDALGNLCRRTNTGWATRDYTYQGRSGCGLGDAANSAYGSGGTGTTGPHRATELISGSNVMTHTYDARGNMIRREITGSTTRTIAYSRDNQAHEISEGGQLRRFWYGPDGQRYKQVDQDGRTTLYLGNVEIVKLGSATTYRRTVAGVQLHTISGSTTTARYLFHDQLGSVAKIADANGAAVENLDYLAHGSRRNADTQAANGTASTLTPRGFTGHEMLDGLNVIHMNGRIYDAYLGRFLQPDPVIQAPGNLQSWNAYTYVFNNPLAYTDPTGMISWRQVLGIVIIVVAAVTQQYWAISSAAKFWGTVAVGALAGGVSTGTWQGALWGAVSAAAFYGVGEAFSGVTGPEGTGVFGSGLSSGAYGAKVLAHGITGGVMSKLQGGQFGHGFASAGVTQAFAPGIDRIGDGVSNYAGMRVAAAAVLGGTASKLSGGKFANGATTAAFSRAFNEEWHRFNTDEAGEEEHRLRRASPKVDEAPPARGVYSAAMGTVEAAGWENPGNHRQGFGFRVRIRNADGTYFLYAHLDPRSVFLSPGQWVSEGELIGVYARPPNGTASGPHLHFEHRGRNGETLDGAGRLNTVMPNHRITSPINMQRRHPVLNTIRPHRGYDLVEGP